MAHRLPVEVVTHIMRFLSVSDRKEAALVCRAWYEASLDPLLQRDIIIHFYASSAVTTGKTISNLSRRRLPHLVLNDFDSSLDAKAILLKSCEQFGSNLKSLSLKGSNITEKTFVELLSHCKNLVSLDLSCCNSLFMAGTLLEMNADLQLLKTSLANVREVNLSSVRHLSDVTFNRVMTVCENVEKVSLASAQIVFTSAMYNRRGNSRFANSSVLTFTNIMDFVITQQSLKSLNLSKTQIEDEHMEELVSSPGFKLHELILTGCRNVSDEGIGYVCKFQTGLVSLDTRECTDLTNASLLGVSSCLKLLQNLHMNKCKQVTDHAVCALEKLELLQVLDLSECHHISSKGLIQGLCSEYRIRQLTHLNISCTDVCDEFIEKASETLPLLTHLDVGSCFKVTDRSVCAISKHLKYLRYLRLAWCNEITDAGILGSVDKRSVETPKNGNNNLKQTLPKFPTKKQVDSKPVINSSSDKVIETSTIPQRPVPLSNMAGLRSLDLSACKKLTNTGLVKVLSFPELKHLHLAMVPELTDDGLTHIVYKNPSIEELNVSQCKKLTDASMSTLTRQLPRLQSLNVMACEALTDKTVTYIGRACLRLRHLDVSFCGKITHDAMDKLEMNLSSLITVQKRMIDSR